MTVGRISRAMKNQKGFTLVELMVVLVIIGILVAIAIPIYNSVQASAERRTCRANLRIIDSAKAQWNAINVTEGSATAGTLNSYFKNGEWPICPAGGTITQNAVTAAALNAKATCSIHGNY